MKEEQFLQTIRETVKWGDYQNKSELLAILRNSVITYDKTSIYGGKSNYFREFVCLRVPIPMMKTANELKDVLEELASEVYIEPTDTNQDYEFWGLRIKPKPVELDANQYVVEHNVIFDDIKEEIIQGIRNAKYTIWIAVAWFTDEDIFNELLLRKKEGLNIRIITSNEQGNTKIIDKLESNFEVVKVDLKGNYLKNRLHDKFCIIDHEYVMHGSYNWSKNARNNDETWATALDKEFVEKFAKEFLRLYVENVEK